MNTETNIDYFSETRLETDPIELYKALNWYGLKGYTAEEIEKADTNSFYSVYAYDGLMLVGLGRVASDGLTVAVMSGICVREEYRNNGIGEQIVTRLVHYCQSGSYQMNVQLFCEDHLKSWYKKMGFEDFGMGMRKVMIYPEDSCQLRKDFSDIYGVDDLADIAPDFYWNDFTHFGELKYHAVKSSFGGFEPCLHIYLYAENEIEAEMVFEDVSRLNISFNGIRTLLDGFDIIDTEKLGLSMVKRYCIRTLYNQNLNFFCGNFKVMNVVDLTTDGGRLLY